MIDIFLALIIGAIAPKHIEKLKKTTGMEPRTLLLLFALLAGVLYAGYSTFVPMDVQAGVLEFVGMAVTTSVMVYEYILKAKKK